MKLITKYVLSVWMLNQCQIVVEICSGRVGTWLPRSLEDCSLMILDVTVLSDDPIWIVLAETAFFTSGWAHIIHILMVLLVFMNFVGIMKSWLKLLSWAAIVDKIWCKKIGSMQIFKWKMSYYLRIYMCSCSIHNGCLKSLLCLCLCCICLSQYMNI